MRGKKQQQVSMLTLRSPEQMVPKGHPLRKVRVIAERALADLEPVFEGMYSHMGRPSVPPERLLKGLLLIAFYSVRSERLFCEQLQYNMLFRWFLDMELDEEPFDASTFSQNRERWLEHEVGRKFFARVLNEARQARLVSDEHFTVDGTLIEAWASMKSFQKKDGPPKPPPDDPGNPSVDFHGEKRTNETHESKTDPDARLARKGAGKASQLAHAAHALMENRHGLVVALTVTPATGRAEREAALEMLDTAVPGTRRITLAADKAYDTREFIAECRDRRVTPHIARQQHSTIDGRTVRHSGYVLSQKVRKRVEEIWGWMKTIGGFRKTRFRGRPRTQLAAEFIASAYNLLRIAKLAGA
jgi:transposase